MHWRAVPRVVFRSGFYASRNTIRARVLFLGLMLCWAPLPVAQAQTAPPRVRISDLKDTRFAVGRLTFTITRFRGSVLGVTNGYVQVRVENASDQAERFSPLEFSIVGSYGRQASIVSAHQTGVRITDGTEEPKLPQEKIIAPNAFIEEFYQLGGKVKLPARVYYSKTALATITK